MIIDSKHLNLLRRSSLVLVILVGIVLSMKSVREPDLWWQLRTGEWMLEHGEVTRTDVFSYSYAGVEWVNVKWGYEVLQALTSKLGGPEFLSLMQVIVTVLLLLVLMRTTLVFGRHLMGEDYRPSIGTALILLIGLVIMEFRITGRPECVSHLMAGAFVLLFVQHRYKPSYWLFLIVPLQVLWSNLHEAYAIGVVFSVMFTGAAWMEHRWSSLPTGQAGKTNWYSGSKDIKVPKLMTFALLGCIAAVAINPRGLQLLTHASEIFSQLGENKFTTELFSFTNAEFWSVHSVLSLSFIAISLYLFSKRPYLAGKAMLSPWKLLVNSIGLGYILLLLAVTYLTLSAYRNIPFIVIATVPLLAVAGDKWLHIKEERSANPKYYLVLLGVGVLFYVSVVSNLYYRAFNPRERFGLEVNASKAPHGAATFIKDNNIEGTAFTDLLSSSYLLWYLQPDFKTYVDLRDLDIFPAVFVKNNFLIYNVPEKIFPYADGDRTFDYIVLLNNPLLNRLHRYLLGEPTFELVYADELASVYVRFNVSNQALIEELGFKTLREDVFHVNSPIEPHGLAKFLTYIFNPFHKFQDEESLNANKHRRMYYQYLGMGPHDS